MSAKAERRSLEEQIGVAINSSNLADRSAECAIERVAAFGAATLHLRSGASDSGLPIAAHLAASAARAPDRVARDTVHGELAAALWHLDYGRQDSQLEQAITLLAEWVKGKARMQDVDPALLRPFSARVLHELLSPMCVRCGGSGKLERSRTGQWIRPRGSMQRNATFGVCPGCHGSRRQPASMIERRRALGIEREQYEIERWDRRFEAARRWCAWVIAPTLRNPLTAQLERRRKHD